MEMTNEEKSAYEIALKREHNDISFLLAKYIERNLKKNNTILSDTTYAAELLNYEQTLDCMDGGDE
jgi:hypothetical protein